MLLSDPISAIEVIAVFTSFLRHLISATSLPEVLGMHVCEVSLYQSERVSPFVRGPTRSVQPERMERQETDTVHGCQDGIQRLTTELRASWRKANDSP